MKIRNNGMFGFFLCFCLAICSCQHNNNLSSATKIYEAELSERKKAEAESNRLYEKTMTAYSESRSEDAVTHLTEAVNIDSQNSKAWMALGVLKYERGRIFEAARAFHRASRLEPTRYEPHFNLGSIFESVGYHEQAIEEYKIALKLAPSKIEVMENLARCYFRSGKNTPNVQNLVRQALQKELRPEWRRWLEMQNCEKSFNKNGE